MIKEFKEKLKLELDNGLPGDMAHCIMMPTARDKSMVMPTFHTPPVKSAVLVLFYLNENRQIEFPLIQRPTYNGAHSAQVSFPGGKAEPEDHSIEETALREAEEEIGVDRAAVEVIGHLSDLIISVSNFIVTPVIGFMDKKPKFRQDPVEVEAIISTRLTDIIDPELRREGMVLVRGKYNIQTPYFHIDNRVVWGATAMMLSELGMVIEKTGIFPNSIHNPQQ